MKDIEKLRRHINKIDHQIIELLAQRMKIVKKIGLVKKNIQKNIIDITYWKTAIEDREMEAVRHSLSTKFIKDIWNIIHSYALKIEKEL